MRCNARLLDPASPPRLPINRELGGAVGNGSWDLCILRRELQGTASLAHCRLPRSSVARISSHLGTLLLRPLPVFPQHRAARPAGCSRSRKGTRPGNRSRLPHPLDARIPVLERGESLASRVAGSRRTLPRSESIWRELEATPPSHALFASGRRDPRDC